MSKIKRYSSLKGAKTFSITAPRIMTVSIKGSFTTLSINNFRHNSIIMLVIAFFIVILIVVMLSAVMLSVIMLSVIMLSVVMLSVVKGRT